MVIIHKNKVYSTYKEPIRKFFEEYPNAKVTVTELSRILAIDRTIVKHHVNKLVAETYLRERRALPFVFILKVHS